MKRKVREFGSGSTCYIKDHSKYRKITYGELKKMRKIEPEVFSNRWFIPVGGTLLEVSHQDYLDFYRERDRQDYLDDLDRKYRMISYETLKEQGYREKEVIDVKEEDVYKIVETGMLFDKLRKALLNLSKDEASLIKALYFDDLTIKDISLERGISINATYKQKYKILRKLRKMLED